MSKLIGKNIKLRALELTDIDFLYDIENNDTYWGLSNTQTPFSRYTLEQYIKNAHLDIYEAKQIRFAIESKKGQTIGMIDLFDFNPQHLRAGLGILIASDNQRKGYATEAIELLNDYAFSYLNLRQLYVNINLNNQKSIQLFEKLGYQFVGIRKDWILNKGSFKDVAFYQLINSKINEENIL